MILTADVRPPRQVKQEREKLPDLGRKLFVERCSSCHGARGEKALRTGPPLRERKLAREDIASAVRGRLKTATEEQRGAVTLYILSFMDK
jgi:mono/diheme cytochrome c family protein